MFTYERWLVEARNSTEENAKAKVARIRAILDELPKVFTQEDVETAVLSFPKTAEKDLRTAWNSFAFYCCTALDFEVPRVERP